MEEFKMNFTTMENLQYECNNSNGAVIRYKDSVVVVEYKCKTYEDPKNGYVCKIYSPVETEEETGYDFIELRLELSNDFDDVFETVGEALEHGFKQINMQ